MEKIARITTFKDEGTDYSFWLTKSYQERLEAVEMLRNQYINFRKDVPERLQRVCTIIQKTTLKLLRKYIPNLEKLWPFIRVSFVVKTRENGNGHNRVINCKEQCVREFL